jgi:aminopeptidase
MTDPRYTKLADLLVNYSTELKKGEHVMLDMIDTPDEMAIELMRAVRRKGAIPIIETRHSRITREIVRDTNEKQAETQRDIEMFRMKKVQSYIAIRGADNASETTDVPSNLMASSRSTRQQNQMVRLALAHTEHGPGREHEH